MNHREVQRLDVRARQNGFADARPQFASSRARRAANWNVLRRCGENFRDAADRDELVPNSCIRQALRPASIHDTTIFAGSTNGVGALLSERPESRKSFTRHSSPNP